MVLHTPTVIFVFVLLLAESLLVDAVNWRLHRNVRGPGYWLASSALRFAGMVLLLLRDRIDDLFSIPVALMLLNLGLVCNYLGLRRFAALPERSCLPMLVLLPAGWSYYHFTFDHLWLVGRTLTVGLVHGVLHALCILCLLSLARREGILGLFILLVRHGITACTYLVVPYVLYYHEQDTAVHLASSGAISFALTLVLLLEVVQTHGNIILLADHSRRLLEISALQDPLTNLPNRRAFHEYHQRTAAQAVRQHCPIALVLFDLDHFKRINDTYGHHAGDAMLQHFASVARDRLRPSDVLARIGGEEFALLLYNADQGAALEVAERIRTGLATTPLQQQEHLVRCTLSGGIAVGGPGETFSTLYHEADKALYQAKHEGRNRIVLPLAA